MAQLTLGELLVSRGTSALTLVSGGPDALERPVRGVHSTEMEHPTMWVEKEWVVLTSGLNLKRQPERQRRLVRELDEAGVTALGFGVGSAFSVVPPTLLKAAQEADFPVFSIPWDTSFRDMIRDVYEAQLSDDIRAYQRLIAMQHYLLDALADESPREAVLSRLASLTEGTAGLLAAGGRVVHATGELPARELWDVLASRSPMVTETQVGRWNCVAVPLSDKGDGAIRWLVVAGHAGSFSGLSKRIMQATAPLLSAMDRIDAAARGQERQIKASLLEALLEAAERADRRSLAARAGQLGIEGAGRSRVVVVEGELGEDAEPVEAAEEALDSVGAAGLVASREGRLIAIVEPLDGDDWRPVVERLGACFPAAAIGLGRALDSVADASRSHQDALLAIRSLAPGAGRTARFYDELDLDATLLGEVPAERWAAKAAELLAPLAEHPELTETLETYFVNELDAVKTAENLHLHPNSLRYRLRRIEQLLGRSLRDPSTIASLQLARLGGRDAGGPLCFPPAEPPSL